jgi:hypothetical protein
MVVGSRWLLRRSLNSCSVDRGQSWGNSIRLEILSVARPVLLIGTANGTWAPADRDERRGGLGRALGQWLVRQKPLSGTLEYGPGL